MKATEMHDLLRDSLAALQQKPYWHFGEGQFSSIAYCDYCGYSQSHGHGEKCVIPRLESVVNGLEAPEPSSHIRQIWWCGCCETEVGRSHVCACERSVANG